MRSEFERIYNEYSSGICGFLYKLCGSASLAEELTQETFYQAYKSLHRYNGSCELFTWLAAIAKNTYFKYLRKHKRELLGCELSELEGVIADIDERPEDLAERRELRDAVIQAVTRLGKKYRDVVVLRIYAELPFSAIAEFLGITENSAKVIFHRAKRQLEAELKSQGFIDDVR
ncbi:MAG TPA: sigma-70 family RNA polymerase sigma factor [Bacillota bacterium]|nr:sigma-70 family RNA polymerase sigma factor [Clostridiales bacterium]HPT85411.1 sigma-70 family RNA polymerase sigma factor [Bacillota bacterium]